MLIFSTVVEFTSFENVFGISSATKTHLRPALIVPYRRVVELGKCSVDTRSVRPPRAPTVYLGESRVESLVENGGVLFNGAGIRACGRPGLFWVGFELR